MGGSECKQSEQEDPVMSVTGEARVSEIMSLNIQVSSTGKTEIQQLLLGRVLESGCWSHPLFFCCCYFFYWWVRGMRLYFPHYQTSILNHQRRVQHHWCCLCLQTDTLFSCLDLCVYIHALHTCIQMLVPIGNTWSVLLSVAAPRNRAAAASRFNHL